MGNFGTGDSKRSARPASLDILELSPAGSPIAGAADYDGAAPSNRRGCSTIREAFLGAGSRDVEYSIDDREPSGS